jgi:hypothetical protein
MSISFEQREFLRLWQAEGFDRDKRDECLLLAGYADSTIKHRGKKIAMSANELVCRTMDRKGLTVEKIVEKHAEQLEAVDAKNPEAADNNARLRAVDMAYKIRGVYPNPKIEIDKKEISVSITMETLRAAEAATGDSIIDLLPEDVIEDEAQDAGRRQLEENCPV